MKRPTSSPGAYIASITGEQRAILDALRDAIAAAVPEAEEDIGHGMLDYPGLCNLGAQKHHVALYVAPDVLDRHRDSFPDCGRSCLRFTRLEQVDGRALRKLLREVWKERGGKPKF